MIPADGIAALVCIIGPIYSHILFVFIITANYMGQPLSLGEAHKLSLNYLCRADCQRRVNGPIWLGAEFMHVCITCGNTCVCICYTHAHTCTYLCTSPYTSAYIYIVFLLTTCGLPGSRTIRLGRIDFECQPVEAIAPVSRSNKHVSCTGIIFSGCDSVHSQLTFGKRDVLDDLGVLPQSGKGLKSGAEAP